MSTMPECLLTPRMTVLRRVMGRPQEGLRGPHTVCVTVSTASSVTVAQESASALHFTKPLVRVKAAHWGKPQREHRTPGRADEKFTHLWRQMRRRGARRAT